MYNKKKNSCRTPLNFFFYFTSNTKNNALLYVEKNIKKKKFLFSDAVFFRMYYETLITWRVGLAPTANYIHTLFSFNSIFSNGRNDIINLTEPYTQFFFMYIISSPMPSGYI